MIDYIIELKMADKKLKISKEIEEIIINAAIEANKTTVSTRNKRHFSVEKRIDDYTLAIKIQSPTTINPTRTFSTLTRAVLKDKNMRHYVEGHLVNGCIFSTRLLREDGANIIHISDTTLVSEVVSILFENNFSPKEKKLALETADQIRSVIIDYKNKKNNL